MREFKFRAWDSDNKKMLYPTSQIAYFKFTNVIHELINISQPNGTYTTKISRMFNGKLMDFIGYQDTNAIDIYDADIVTYKGLIGKIIYYHAKFLIKFPKKISMLAIPMKNLEVIGNLYENPELLEKD